MTLVGVARMRFKTVRIVVRFVSPMPRWPGLRRRPDVAWWAMVGRITLTSLVVGREKCPGTPCGVHLFLPEALDSRLDLPWLDAGESLRLTLAGPVAVATAFAVGRTEKGEGHVPLPLLVGTA